MRIEPTEPAHLRYVAERMRPKDLAEFLPLTDVDGKAEMIEFLVERYGWRRNLVTACDDAGVPVAVGGMVQHRPNVGSLLMYATDRFPEIAHPLTRFIKKTLFPQGRAAGLHRIEAVSLADYTEAHRWIEHLGLRREAVLPGYGRGGETYLNFAWVNPYLARPERMLVSGLHGGRNGQQEPRHVP